MARSSDDEGHPGVPDLVSLDVLRTLPVRPTGCDDEGGIDFTKRAAPLMYESAVLEELFLRMELQRSTIGYTFFLFLCLLGAVFVGYITPTSSGRLSVAIYGSALAVGFVFEIVVVWCIPGALGRLHFRAREAAATLALYGPPMVFGYEYMLSQSDCRYVWAYDGRASDTDCPYQLFSFWFSSVMFPLLLGRPRALVVALVALPLVLFPFALRLRYEGAHTNLALAFVTALTYAVLVVALKHIDEWQHRQQFEARLTLQAHSEELRLRHAALAEFVREITPPFLRPRLSARGAVTLDVADPAVCAVVDVNDCARFMISLLPMQSALAVGQFTAQCAALARQHAVHLVRTVGDVSTVVSGLFDLREAADGASLLAVAALRMVRFALGVRDSCALEARCSAAAGPLMGMPLGGHCIRYDVGGPALVCAQTLLVRCPARTVRVDARIAVHLAERYDMEYHGVSSTSTSTSGSGTSASAGCDGGVRHDDGIGVTIVGPAQATASATAIDVAFADGSSTGDKPEVSKQLLRRRVTAAVPLEAPGVEMAPTAEHVRCFVCRTFVHERTEAAFVGHSYAQHHRPFAMCVAFHAVFSCVLVVDAALDRREDADVELVLGGAMIGACAVANAVLAWRLWRSIEHGLHVVLWAFVLAVLTLIGANLTRPSIIGDDTAYLVFLFLASSVFWGAPLKWTLRFQIGIAFAFIFLTILHRPLLTFAIIFFVPLLFVGAAECCRSREVQQRMAFVASVMTVGVLHEIVVEQQLREAVLEALVPQRLRVLLSPHMFAAPKLDAWSADDVVCIELQVAPGAFAQWAASPDEYRARMEALIEAVRCTTRGARHGALDLVKVFGASLLVAGPLVERGAVVATADAVGDALELLEFALLRAGVALTCGAAVEQVVHVLRLSAFPQFDLFGPSVSAARALVQAAPAPMAVVTEKVAKIYATQCVPQQQGRAAVAVGERGEQWRLRSLGSVRVFQVAPVLMAAAGTEEGSEPCNPLAIMRVSSDAAKVSL